jgi:hypothetical protein
MVLIVTAFRKLITCSIIQVSNALLENQGRSRPLRENDSNRPAFEKFNFEIIFMVFTISWKSTENSVVKRRG